MSLQGRAVFFDFDGVLADSVGVKTEAFVSLYAPHGPDVTAKVRSYHLANGGMSRFEKFAHFQRHVVHGPDDPETLERLGEQFAQAVKAGVIAAPEIAGARDTLQVLSRLMPLFVVSATPQRELVDIIAARGLASYITAAHGTPRTKRDIIADLLDAQRLDPGRCLMVGDAMADLEAAWVHGIRFIGVVAADGPDPFPAGTEVVADLVGFAGERLKEWGDDGAANQATDRGRRRERLSR